MTKLNRASAAAAAAHIDVSTVTFSRLLNENIIERQPRELGYDLDDVRVRYVRHLRKIAAGHGTGKMDLAAERARLAREQTETAALRNAFTRGELVSISTVQKFMARDYSVIREHFLAMPSTISVALDDGDPERRALIENVLRAKIREILSNLAEPDDQQRDFIAGGIGSATN